MRRWAFAYLSSLIATVAAAGCGGDACVRKSDCPTGLSCVAGQCVETETRGSDASADLDSVPSDGDVPDGGLPDGAPKDAEIREDAPADADVTADALADGEPSSDAPQDVSADAQGFGDATADMNQTDAEADASADASTDGGADA